MDNNVIEVTGISEPLLKLIDERVSHSGGDRAAYVRDLIEKDIYSVSTPSSKEYFLERQKHSKSSQGTKRPFDLEAWEADMKLLAQAPEVPVLPEEAFTRESIYGNHD